MHPAYRMIDGKEYVLVEHSINELKAMANDTIKVIANFVEKWDGNNTELANAIRSTIKE